MTSSLTLNELLDLSAERHDHLFPRQVLGVRIGLAGVNWLDLEVPRKDKRLLVIIETDGCFTDGIEASTGVTVGQRRLRIEDYGKVAATLIDTFTGMAVRVSPQAQARQRAAEYAPGAADLYAAQLIGYQQMPEAELLEIIPVRLRTSIESIISKPGLRVECASCGEEIMNEREVELHGQLVCRSCAGESYYLPVKDSSSCQ